MPEPTVFLSRQFPPVSIIRPTATKGAAMGAVQGLTDDGLFIGQSKEFFELLNDLAEDADGSATSLIAESRPSLTVFVGLRAAARMYRAAALEGDPWLQFSTLFLPPKEGQCLKDCCNPPTCS